MLYESNKHRKKVFNKLSKVMDEDDEEDKPEDRDEVELGGAFDDLDVMPVSGRKGHRDHTLDDPYIEALENNLHTILEKYAEKIGDAEYKKAAGSEPAGTKPDKPSAVTQVGVLGTPNPKVKKKTFSHTRRADLNPVANAGADAKEGEAEGEETEGKEKQEKSELDKLKSELGMGGPDASA